jgi:hypothetical protein
MRGSDMEHYADDAKTGACLMRGIRERPLEHSGFTIRWNPYRSLKPQAGRNEEGFPSNNNCLFACESPSHPLSLLARRVSLQATLKNFDWAATPNAFPVEQRGHFLWVPITRHGPANTFPHMPQMLSLPLVQDFLSLARSSKNSITFFNSMHAGASVDHLHFQSVYHAAPTALQQAGTISAGSRILLEAYPASGVVYQTHNSASAIWDDVRKLQNRGIPLNLIHAGGLSYLIPRDPACEMVEEFPNAVLASMELSGTAITTDEAFFRTATWNNIHMALHKSTLRSRDLEAILNS